MRVALVELDPRWEDEAANRALVREALRPVDVDLAVLPEMAFTGFSMAARPDPEAEPFLSGLARERGMALLAGHVADEGGGRRNRALVVDARGRPLLRYDKLHPFSFAGEDRHFGRGTGLPLCDLGGLRAAVFICYDLRFPEAFREAALRGAEAFFVIANWPQRRVDHWHTLLRARAIENQAIVVGVNRVGRDPNESYDSSSLAVGPKGETLHEGAGTVVLDPEGVRSWRAEFPALRDVRTDRYPFPRA